MNGLTGNRPPMLNGLYKTEKNTMGNWQFTQDRDTENLSLRKNGKVLYRFLHEPNIFARVSYFTAHQNGDYSLIKADKLTK